MLIFMITIKVQEDWPKFGAELQALYYFQLKPYLFQAIKRLVTLTSDLCQET